VADGWICLHRSLLEWEWYDDKNACRLFIHLLLKANHKPKKWRGITIESGSLIAGRHVLSAETGLSEQQIRTSLNKLKSTNGITIKSTNKYSMISICCWSKYQDNNQQVNQQVTNKQPTNNQQVTTNNNVTIKQLNKQTNNKTSCPQPEADMPEVVEPPIFELPTNKFNTSSEVYPVNQIQIDQLSNLYPAVDVPQQFRNMIGWLNSNSSKRKTLSGVPKFMNSWLAKDQNRGGSNGANQSTGQNRISAGAQLVGEIYDAAVRPGPD